MNVTKARLYLLKKRADDGDRSSSKEWDLRLWFKEKERNDENMYLFSFEITTLLESRNAK